MRSWSVGTFGSEGICTVATPTASKSKENHCRMLIDLPYSTTLNKAVVKTFVWDVTAKVAALLKLLTAKYWSELTRVYARAGIASFQLSSVKTLRTSSRMSEVTGREVDMLLDRPYRAMVSEKANLMTSTKKTAVDA